jgi:hypothetical protein
MRRLVTLVSVVVAVAVLTATPVQAVVTENDSIDIDLVVFVPCANGGVGELVELNGPLHILLTFTINGNNISGKTHFQPEGISGVGLDTGDRYHATGVTQDHFKGSLSNGQFNQIFVNNFRIIDQDPGNNFLVHENFHLTITANGAVTAVHDNFSIDCK